MNLFNGFVTIYRVKVRESNIPLGSYHRHWAHYLGRNLIKNPNIHCGG